MKKRILSLLAVCILLAGCSELIPPKSTVPPETEPVTTAETIPETQPVTEPETEPEQEFYVHPLNGSILTEPFNHRIYAVSINNLREAVPHTNVVNADMYFESFVNGSIIRGLALFSEPEGLNAIGPVRSNRFMFNDISLHYDCIMIHAGGSYQVVNDCNARKVDNINIDGWGILDTTSFRDNDRYHSGYAWEHCLYGIGDGIVKYAEDNGYRTTANPELDYRLQFANDGTPENGVDAENIAITITVGSYKKNTSMIYDADLDRYVYHQYDKDMVDGLTGQKEAFQNVLIVTGEIYYDGPFQRLRMLEGGTGWFACGGKAIPIRWGCDSDTSPLWFTTEDGTPLTLGRGNTYIAITQTGSQITGIGA